MSCLIPATISWETTKNRDRHFHPFLQLLCLVGTKQRTGYSWGSWNSWDCTHGSPWKTREGQRNGNVIAFFIKKKHFNKCIITKTRGTGKTSYFFFHCFFKIIRHLTGNCQSQKRYSPDSYSNSDSDPAFLSMANFPLRLAYWLESLSYNKNRMFF